MSTRSFLATILIVCLLGCPVYSQQAVPVAGTNSLPAVRSAAAGAESETAQLLSAIRALEARVIELESNKSQPLPSITPDTGVAPNQEEASVDLSEAVQKNRGDIEELTNTLDELGDAQAGLLFHSHKTPKATFYGRIHLDYWAFPKVDPGIYPIEGGNPQDRVAFRRMRIGIKGDLNDNMFYKYEGEFAGGVASSYRDAYIGFRDNPWFNTIIMGNHKRPYGLDHLNSSRYNVFIERPFIVEAFNQDSRRLGISSNGISKDMKYNWRYGIWNQRLTQTSPGYIGDHYQAELAGRFAATPWYDESSGGRGYFHWAVAGSVASPDGNGAGNEAEYRSRPEARSTRRWIDTEPIVGANTSKLYGLEAVWNNGPLQFVGEFMSLSIERTGNTDVDFHGGYFYVSYFLTGEHMPWERKTGTLGRIKPFENFFSVRDCDGCVRRGWGAWQVAGRYSYADLTDDNINGGDAEAFTLGLNWYWNPYARMQFNYIIGDLKREPLGSGDYEIFGVRFMVDF